MIYVLHLMRRADLITIIKRKSLIIEISSTERRQRSLPLKENLPSSLIRDIRSERTLTTYPTKFQSSRKRN